LRKEVLGVALVALIAGCGVSPAGTYNGVPVSVCGTREDIPVRVEDERCSRNDADVLWYTAQNPRALDRSDRTGIGEEVDDDYLEWDDVDSRHAPRSHTTPPRTSARSTPAPRATTPRATQAPQADSGMRRPTTRVRSR